MIMNKIEMYLLAVEYSSNMLFCTNKKAMKMASTRMYFTQKRPSLTTIANLFLQAVNTIISRNRIRKLREMR